MLYRWHVTQPVTFTIRASLASQSVPQLRWLMEMVPGSSLTLVSSSEALNIDDLLYVRHSLPKHAVFYDIPHPLRTQFIALKDDTLHFPHKQLSLDDSETFVTDQWKVIIYIFIN